MRRHQGRTGPACALRSAGPLAGLASAALASAALALACAADPGDPVKGSAPGSSSGSSSGSGNGSSSSGTGSSSGSGGASSSGIGSTSSSSGGAGSSGSGAGSSSGTGSSSGPVGDDGGPPDAGPIVPEGGASCVTTGCPLKVQYKTSTTGATTTTLGPDLNIVNEGAAADLSTIKVHYYFTAEGDTSLTFNCDYAGYFNSGMTGFSSANVSGAFVSMGANATPYADTYLEISFSTASLPASATVSVNFRIHDSAYATMYSQTNDWSFFSNTGSASYVDAPYITAYANGSLSWGIEPGPIAPDAGPAGDSSVTDAAADARPDATLQDASASDAAHPADAADGG